MKRAGELAVGFPTNARKGADGRKTNAEEKKSFFMTALPLSCWVFPYTRFKGTVVDLLGAMSLFPHPEGAPSPKLIQ
jgi:hypothetical protein